MPQKGEHTWDLYLHYHRCPKCGNIIESRQDYEKRFNKDVKELTCNRCQHHFTITKTENLTIGPFTGEPQPAEFDWSSNSDG